MSWLTNLVSVPARSDAGLGPIGCESAPMLGAYSQSGSVAACWH